MGKQPGLFKASCNLMTKWEPMPAHLEKRWSDLSAQHPAFGNHDQIEAYKDERATLEAEMEPWPFNRERDARGRYLPCGFETDDRKAFAAHMRDEHRVRPGSGVSIDPKTRKIVGQHHGNTPLGFKTVSLTSAEKAMLGRYIAIHLDAETVTAQVISQAPGGELYAIDNQQRFWTFGFDPKRPDAKRLASRYRKLGESDDTPSGHVEILPAERAA